MRIEQVTPNIYFIEQYPGRLTGTEAQRLLYTTFGTEFPVEEWEIRITTTSIGTDRISSALIERRR